MNISRRQIQSSVDAVLLMGGNIRGNADYPEGSFFSMEALEAEVKSNEIVCVVPMPGWLLSAGVQATHSGDPIPGWMQYDDGIQQDETGAVTHVNGERLEENRIYRVGKSYLCWPAFATCASWSPGFFASFLLENLTHQTSIHLIFQPLQPQRLAI